MFLIWGLKMEKYIVGVVLMDKNGKIYRWCYFDVKILTIFWIYFVLMIQNVGGKNCIGVGVLGGNTFYLKI